MYQSRGMKLSLRLIIPLALMSLLSACNFFTPPQSQSLGMDMLGDTNNATELAALYASATSETDRMMGTMEAVQTSVRAVEQQSTRISSTLIAQGTAIIDVSLITPIAPTALAFSASGSGAPAQLDQSVQPIVTPGGIAQGNVALSTPTITPQGFIEQAVQAAQPTSLPVDPNAPQLTNITLTSAVGSDDCPIGSSTTFTTASTDIYVTAVAQNVTPNNTLASRWLMDGTEMVVYTWTPTFNINGACIWFHMPASAVQYVAGNWSVELTIDGVISGSPIAFTITG
jgi:hypothetical protein